jgi:multiple sugar transport system substrate-binding protein
MIAAHRGIVVMVALGLFASACGGGGAPGAPSGDSGGGAVKPAAGDTLTLLGFGEGDDVAQARAKIARKALAPAKVKSPEGEFNDQQFLASVASGDVPDLVYIDREKVGTYAAKGAFQSLDSCISGQHIDMSQYRDAAVKSVTYDGQVYGIPEFLINRVMIIDSGAAKQAGVPVSDLSSTDWDKLKQTARKLTRMSGGKLQRIGFDPKIPEYFPLWAKANGADIISADGKTAQLDDPKVVAALDYTVGLVNAQGGWNRFKSFRDTWDFFGEGNQVAKDQIGGWPMEDWYLNVLSDVSPKVKITTAPFTDRQGRPIDYATGSAWAIPRGAKHPELACLWAKTMTTVDAWMAAAQARIQSRGEAKFTGLHTGNQAADARIARELVKPADTQWSQARETVDKVQDAAFSLPASAAGVEIRTAWENAINRVLAGKQSAAEALKQAQGEAQQALDANGG